MPHATSDEQEDDFNSVEIQNFLRGNGVQDIATIEYRAIDQTDKADDAVDYEDFEDDDLPEEEGATQPLPEDYHDQIPGLDRMGGLPPPQPYTNGHHAHNEQPSSDDLPLDGEDPLFGDSISSPEQERHPKPDVSQAPQQRPSALALPTKSGLALPGSGTFQPSRPARPPISQRSQHSPTSSSPPLPPNDVPGMSPASASGSDEEMDTTGMDAITIQQMTLFRQAKRKHHGDHADEEEVEVDMGRFREFFPDYQRHQNPRFTELFPQKPVQYRGKVPLKPPKPVQPNKLVLDLLQDQERSFRSVNPAKHGNDASYTGNLVFLQHDVAADDDSDDGQTVGLVGEDELVGGMTMEDLAMICQDWGMPSYDTASLADGEMSAAGDWDAEDRARPTKRPRLDILEADLSTSLHQHQLPFDEPERAAAKLAKGVSLDLNDPNLMIDEHAQQNGRKAKRIPGDVRRDAALARDLAKRYNISNDEAYDLLKENHQHKVRSMLGATSIEHSMPATKLQYPFYKVSLEPGAKRSFHRPSLDLKLRHAKEEFKMGKFKTIKKKERRGKDIKELFATAENLALNDNASVLLAEYSEEAPSMLSNFGMGNKLINFYRKRNPDDQERPKRDIGELSVLLTQDKSPFSNFGHVDQGEVVPTLQNTLFRAPVFQHQAKPTDFLVAISTTHAFGTRMYLRNMENLHTVGQQFPVSEVPGEHSRRVTDAAKKRLRAIAYRIYMKSLDPTRRNKQLNNHSIMAHLKGHDMPQTRSKMREFMAYEKGSRDELGVWIPKPGQPVPDIQALRSWLKPEDICLLDSMQVGVQRLTDLGLSTKGGEDEEKDVDENANIEESLAPWQTTRNFIQATQGKAMLQLHGEGDPTGRGEGFNFVKTSMKGGFQPVGESVEDKLDAKKRRENGGHSYNVAKQQKAYDGFIRQIWEKQKTSLSSNIDMSDTEMDDDIDAEPEGAMRGVRGATPRSSFAGASTLGRRDDETGTQFSRASADRHGNNKVLVIDRIGDSDSYMAVDDSMTRREVTNPRVIREYRRRRNEKRLEKIDVFAYQPDGVDPELDRLVKQKLEEELSRVKRNAERREARERAKGGVQGAGSPPASTAGSPGPSDAEARAPGVNGSTDVTPQKGRGRNKDGTARKCANCGQVGHIKTNRKSVFTFICIHCDEKNKVYPDGRVEKVESGERKPNGAAVANGRSEKPVAGLDSFSDFHL